MEKKGIRLKDNMYVRLFLAFFKMGLFTFGGGMAMVPLLEEKMCNEYKWMTKEEVLDCLAISQSLPGVIAINMSIYTGYIKKGVRGALAACLGMILPSFLIIILVATILGSISDIPVVQGALKGITAAATGLIAWAAISMGRQVLKNAFQWIVALAAFILIAFVGINSAWIVIGAIGTGMIYGLAGSKKAASAAKKSAATGDRPGGSGKDDAENIRDEDGGTGEC